MNNESFFSGTCNILKKEIRYAYKSESNHNG